MRKTLPRLSAYHLTLAVVFFASAFTVPFLVDAVFWALTGIAAALFAVTAATFMVHPMYIFVVMGGVFAAVLVTAQVAVNEMRKRIFGFPRLYLSRCRTQVYKWSVQQCTAAR
jgi:hypothetical protein